jgi:hypothetical protein
MNILTTRGRRSGPAREELAAALKSARRWSGLRLDGDRLTADERHDLHRLHSQITADAEHGVVRDDPRYLADPRDRAAFETLVAKAADLPHDFFEAARKEASMHRRVAELAARVRRPGPRARHEEAGCVVLPKQWAFEFQRGQQPVLWPAHIGLLAWLEAIWENGESLSRLARLEGSGDDQALVFDQLMGLLPASADPDGNFTAWKPLLAHLELNGFVEVDRSSRQWRIKRGPRSLAARNARNES